MEYTALNHLQIVDVLNPVNATIDERANFTNQAIQLSGRLPAGLYFRLSQTGVNYVTQLISEALPQLLIGETLPPIKDSTFSITKLKIEKFENPTIDAKFVANSGIYKYCSTDDSHIVALRRTGECDLGANSIEWNIFGRHPTSFSGRQVSSRD